MPTNDVHIETNLELKKNCPLVMRTMLNMVGILIFLKENGGGIAIDYFYFKMGTHVFKPFYYFYFHHIWMAFIQGRRTRMNIHSSKMRMSRHEMVVTLGNLCVVFLSKCVDPRPRNCCVVVFSNGNCVELPPTHDCVKEWPFHGGKVLLGNCLEKWLFCLTKWQVMDWLRDAHSHIPSLEMLDFISKFAIFTNNYQIM
jgi:hypothetical protein